MVVEEEDAGEKKKNTRAKSTQEPPTKKKRKVAPALKADPSSLPSCPIHSLATLQQKTSSSGWEYYVCPEKDCFVFTGAGDIELYLHQLGIQLQEYYKSMDLSLWQCQCQEPVTLSLSRSEKNPHRLYFRCSRRVCPFFQWADQLPKYLPCDYPKQDDRHFIL